MNVISFVEVAQGLKQRASKGRMAGRIRRKWRCEIRSVKITCRCPKWREGQIAARIGIAVALAKWSSPWIGLADTGYRTPEVVVIL